MLFAAAIEMTDTSTERQIEQFAREHGCTANLLDVGNNAYLFTSYSYDCLEELAMQVFDCDVSNIIFSIPD